MERAWALGEIQRQFEVHPVCAVLGPRQVGKTTLALAYAKKHNSRHFFDLENPLDLARMENPMLAMSGLHGLIIIDEIQRRPELFSVLRVLVDKDRQEGNITRRFLILGSASRDLIQQFSETLAGRVAYIELTPFSLSEVGKSQNLWLRGGFPLSFLARSDEESSLWRHAYIATFLERDIPNLGFSIPAAQMRRFWLMLAHYHGQIFNASELARSLNISAHLVRKYLDILEGTFMMRSLTPWHENLSKRQVKSPKIYFRDSGILHTLLGLESTLSLETHPKLGSFWEGFALEEILRSQHVRQEEAYFWATPSGAELDLLLFHNGKRIGYEFKYSDCPKKTASMKIAIEDLHLDHLYIVFPGDISFPMDEKITARGLYCS